MIPKVKAYKTISGLETYKVIDDIVLSGTLNNLFNKHFKIFMYIQTSSRKIHKNFTEKHLNIKCSTPFYSRKMNANKKW